ncbi:unnamed protein product [Cladocopium goreaui]|uniref:Uncharacterized protein n=1 Tax=Cladocopium goreaui TaxID=2562237 RepID=A0A9P1BQ65_9DINO|nr:unnamed protein product [Cladocopium goreaui]
MASAASARSARSARSALALATLALVSGHVFSGTFAANRQAVNRSGRLPRSAQTDPNFAVNVGEATDTLRNDHAQIPRLAPGLNVADPRVSLEIAQAAKGAFSDLQRTVPAVKDLFSAGDFLKQAEDWTSQQGTQAPVERVVEFNSIYELDCWSGRIVRHTLEFRSPEENFDLLGALQGMPAR